MITITINTDNAAFDTRPECEIARILLVLASKFRHDGMLDPRHKEPIIDINGQRVGSAEVSA